MRGMQYGDQCLIQKRGAMRNDLINHLKKDLSVARQNNELKENRDLVAWSRFRYDVTGPWVITPNSDKEREGTA